MTRRERGLSKHSRYCAKRNAAGFIHPDFAALHPANIVYFSPSRAIEHAIGNLELHLDAVAREHLHNVSRRM
jgi:hypothetical protein